MNSDGSNLRPVTLAELQALETRVSTLVRDLMTWIEGTDSRSAEIVTRMQVVRKRINRTIADMDHATPKPDSQTTQRMFLAPG